MCIVASPNDFITVIDSPYSYIRDTIRNEITAIANSNIIGSKVSDLSKVQNSTNRIISCRINEIMFFENNYPEGGYSVESVITGLELDGKIKEIGLGASLRITFQIFRHEKYRERVGTVHIGLKL